MATVLIDTTVLIDRERGRDILHRLAPDDDTAVSVITVSELLHGVHRARGTTRLRRQSFVEQVLSEYEPIPITEPVARVHAAIWAHLAHRGELIGAHDLWIAATAVTFGLSVATDDPEAFGRVPGLTVL